MSSIIRITSIALLLWSGTETTMFTLSCDGTMTNLVWHSDNKPEPVTNMGLVVNLLEHTVTGFAFPARIYKTDAARVEFRGQNDKWSVWGSMDRVNGTVQATTTSLYPTTIHSWNLVCKSVTTGVRHNRRLTGRWIPFAPPFARNIYVAPLDAIAT
jgi:hypothetical protein